MRRNYCLISISLAAALASAVVPSRAATFGTVVPITGSASDIALDQSRGLLYVANFTANRIDVMSTADYSIHSSMNVAPQPVALALSFDSQFLLIAHYGNFTAPETGQNLVTLINLNTNTQQTFATGDPPLGVAFTSDGQAFIVTTTSFVAFDPISGAMIVLATFADVAQSLPAPLATFPSQVTSAELAISADGSTVYGIASNSTGQAFYRYTANGQILYAIGIVASPIPLPRVSVAADGSYCMIGQYRLDPSAIDLAQFPNSVTSTKIGGVAIDSKNGIIYAQILTASSQTSSSAIPTTTPAASTPPAAPPVLSLLAADNLTVLDTLSLPENIVGRAVLTSAGDVLYALTDSGVTVLPVGKLNQYHRLAASPSDLQAPGSFCNRAVITQYLTITDPGGGNTDFEIGSSVTGVTISPSFGVTPATVQVSVDPNAFINQNGTVTVPLTIASATAVNLPPAVRLLVNSRNPNQRGTVVDVPGNLVDILADPFRGRFYILRQDQNEVLVFDATTYQQITALRTSTTPTQMAITFDQKYLLIGHDNSQLAYVYDLDTFQQQPSITFPPGHYPRSLAASGQAILALARNAGAGGPGMIDTVDFPSHRATAPPSLGVFVNSVNPGGVLTPSPNGGYVLAAMPDGNVMLYDASANTFTVSRKDLTSLGGPYAASSYSSYAIGNNLFNAALVPVGTLETASGAPSGYAFVNQAALRTTASSSSSPGVIERVNQSATVNPTSMVEAPLVPTTAWPFTRTLAPLPDQSAVISLTVSGFTVLPWNYDAAVAPPQITSVVNAADGTQPIAPGGLISVYGQQLSPVNIATQQIPLPTALGESCLTVNGAAVPMLFVSSQQINGQLPTTVNGSATMTLYTPGGISNNFYLSISPVAPSIFLTGTAGPLTGLATVYRDDNGQLITPTNPIHANDIITIYATGMGLTSPLVTAGMPAPANPLPNTVIPATVTLGGVSLSVLYAGLVPGEIGVYQVNASVPFGVPQGMSIPLVVAQEGYSTTLSVRVVD
ncbi:MAG: hypothetical protein ABSG79_14005 [Bryobacteraceae bacterium]|jgi:uncharacterized protein (TIGR03437 family)